MSGGGDWMSVRGNVWNQGRSTNVNHQASLQTIAVRMDVLVEYASGIDSLKRSVHTFTSTHAQAKEEWEAKVRGGGVTPEMRHNYMVRVLMAMCSFAGGILEYIHEQNKYYSSHVPPLDPKPGSVSDAEAFHYATEVIAEALAVCCTPETTQRLQDHILQSRILATLVSMYYIPREVELVRFGEGYRTNIMRVVANATYGNMDIAGAIYSMDFLPHVLSATKIDEENPGLREWAEFAIRNLTSHPAVVQYIKRLQAQRISHETERELANTGLHVTLQQDGSVSVSSREQRERE